MSTLRKLRKTLENLSHSLSETEKPNSNLNSKDYVNDNKQKARLKSYTNLREQKRKHKKDYNLGRNYAHQKRDKREFS